MEKREEFLGNVLKELEEVKEVVSVEETTDIAATLGTPIITFGCCV